MRRSLFLFLAILCLARAGFGRDITVRSGDTFHDVVVTGVEQTGIDIRFQGGTGFLNFSDLPGDVVASFFQTGAPEAPPPALVPIVPADPEETAVELAPPPPELAFVPEIDALDGTIFEDVVVTSIGRTGFRFHHRNGSGFLDFAQLPEFLRHRFGFNESAYASAKAAEQRTQRGAALQRRVDSQIGARQAQLPTIAPVPIQRAPSFSSPSIGTFSTPGFAAGMFRGGGVSSGSTSGRSFSHTGGAAVHASGGRR